jgi:hypothetical protein
MRQIPRYLIIGSGRLAGHLSHWLRLNNLEFYSWSRSGNSYLQLEEFANQSDVAILAISDNYIEDFIQQTPAISNKALIHCSGCLSLDNAIGLHSLMSFGYKLYDDEIYKKIT